MHVCSDSSYMGSAGFAHAEFLSWVQSFIIPDKFKTFQKLYRPPIDTIPLTEEALGQLRKIFHGRDKNIRFEFTSPELTIEWEEFVQKQSYFWQTQGFEQMANSINSVMVIDLPVEQVTDNPEPYISFWDIGTVQDFKLLDESRFEWVMIRETNESVLIYDDGFYRRIKWAGGERIEVEVENPHDLGYCPASFFWTDPISYKEPAVKRSPLTNWLSKLDWFALWATCKKHSDLYAPFPVHTVYEENCTYHNEETGEFCSGGYLMSSDRTPVTLTSGVRKECPSCSADPLAGPGSKIKVARHDPAINVPESIRITGPDIGSLEHILNQEKILKQEIFAGMTGNSISLINDQAINEKQVRSLFEDRIQVLMNLKSNFERAQLFAEETQARLRHGDRFIGGHVSYGSEFYLFSADELYQIYAEARKQKMDHAILDDLYGQYIETRFRESPTQLQRQKILQNLDPFRHLTDEQIDTLYRENNIEQTTYLLKKNFSTYISRFERENVDIVEFGQLIDFNKKIVTIQEALISYITVPTAAPEPEPEPTE